MNQDAKKHVLHIITSFGYGGAETLLINLAKLHVEFYEVTIVVLKNKTELAQCLDKRVKLIVLEQNRNKTVQIRRLIKQLAPAIVHTHLGHADLYTMLASTFLKGRYFSTMHNIWFKKNYKDYFFFGAYLLLLHSIAKKFKVISISKSVHNHVRKIFRLSNERNLLVYNAINTSRLQPREEHLGKRFNVLFIGRLTKQKNLPLLIAASTRLSKQIPELKVSIVGDGEMEMELRQLAIHLKVERIVSFYPTTENVGQYFTKADCFVLPSIFEGFGLVILEAFYCKVPVVASNIEGPKELIEHGVNGLLFESGNVNELIEKVLKVYRDNELGQQMAQAAYHTVKDSFLIEQYATSILQLYEK
jgi:glycosyltransferase involved in cell wall biosynthesis